MTPADRPFLPVLREVYRVRPVILGLGMDPKRSRPAVVLAVPIGQHVRIPVATRTTKLHRVGVPHPADSRLDLDLPGVFSNRTSVDATLWTPGNVKRLGLLDEATWALVSERFES